jgi:hypothetical protein
MTNGHTPTNARPPFNLDALEIEENLAPFVFTFGGEQFSISAHYDPRIFRKFQQGDLAGALLAMLGHTQFDRLDAIDKPFDERHLTPLIEAWAAHDGTSTGEAPASSRSSKSTGGPSKPTSKGSTGSPSQD